MEDMIARIIELDKKAKDELNKAKQSRIESEKKISDIKAKKRDEYTKEALENIKRLEKEEKLKSSVKLKIIENSYAQKYDRMEKIYASHKEEWINKIVERVIEI